MAHGMGAQKDIGLFIYAEKFVEAGMAVLAFDYRCVHKCHKRCCHLRACATPTTRHRTVHLRLVFLQV
jgi:hypothetical protein